MWHSCANPETERGNTVKGTHVTKWVSCVSYVVGVQFLSHAKRSSFPFVSLGASLVFRVVVLFLSFFFPTAQQHNTHARKGYDLLAVV